LTKVLNPPINYQSAWQLQIIPGTSYAIALTLVGMEYIVKTTGIS